ncbi:MAG: DUF3488 and transglutaminase-like domain-containing protein [Magnetococcus sp. DMHC-6]
MFKFFISRQENFHPGRVDVSQKRLKAKPWGMNPPDPLFFLIIKNFSESLAPPWVMLWLLGTLLLTALPHFAHFPRTLGMIIATLAIGWGGIVWKTGHAPNASIWLRLLVVMGILFLVLHEYRSIFGQNPGIALLTGMLFLKLWEFKTRRDPLVILLLANFLAMTHFLYSQSIWMGLYTVCLVSCLLAILIALAHPQLGQQRILRLTGILLTQALPVMLALFILFPRIHTPLWGLPADALSSHAITGLSESLSFGSIDQIIHSNKVVFRVTFQGDLPPPAARYWRGLVLWTLHDGEWRSLQDMDSMTPAEIFSTGPLYRYTITQEPSPTPWLFALDLPVTLPNDAILRHDWQIRTKHPITTVRRYEASSAIHYQAGLELSAQEQKWALQLPKVANPRTRALALAWREKSHSDTEVIQQALTFFREEPFYYTMKPEKLSKHDQMDRFLFDSRRGFCEHFASAFTFLMRAAQIPARVVIGYQGGTRNPWGQHVTVRLADAHAWSEVWLAGEGWVRVDPTAAVAPERVEQENFADSVPENDPIPFILPPGHPWRNFVWTTWDWVDNGWNQWVVGYGVGLQERFLLQMGLGTVTYLEMAMAMGGIVGGLFAFIALFMFRQKQKKVDPVVQLYRQFRLRLEKRGVLGQDYEGSQDLADRACRHCPDKEKEIHQITRLYMMLRYGYTPPKNGVQLLRRWVERF